MIWIALILTLGAPYMPALLLTAMAMGAAGADR